ncbi:hypothetical protein EON64_07840, partial [archaeon]
MEASNKPKRDFKKGISTDDSRRRREETSVKLRKEKKEEGLAKRRNLTITDEPVSENPTVSSGSTEAVAPDLLQFCQMLKSQDIQEQVKGMKGFRRALSIEKNPPVQQCIDLGVIPVFVQALYQHHNMELQFEAAWALTNISSTDYTKLVADCGAIPPLAQLLSSANADIREQSAWCLGNIAGDGAVLRDAILAENAMPALLANIAQPASLSLLRNCTWTLSNFCRGKPQSSLDKVGAALPALAHLIMNQPDPDTIADAAWALSYISDGDDKRIQAVVDLGVVPRLVEMMGSGN